MLSAFTIVLSQYLKKTVSPRHSLQVISKISFTNNWHLCRLVLTSFPLKANLFMVHQSASCGVSSSSSYCNNLSCVFGKRNLNMNIVGNIMTLKTAMKWSHYRGNLNSLTWQYMNEIMAKQLLLVLILYIIFHKNGNTIFN